MAFQTAVELPAADILAAAAALFGAVLGSAVTLAASAIAARREAAFRIREKVTEKRIAAHECVLELLSQLRRTSYVTDPATGRSCRIPTVLQAPSHFTQWRSDLADALVRQGHWLERQVRGELQFTRSYMELLGEEMAKRDEREQLRLATQVADDLIDIYRRAEPLLLDFFDRGAHRFTFRRLEDRRPVDDTRLSRLLANTALSRALSAGAAAVPANSR